MEIMHDKEACTFRTEIDGLTAYVKYKSENGTLDIRHTFVPTSLEGRGIASQLVQKTYEYAREQKLQPLATCSYAVVWLKRHPEYDGKTGENYAGPGSCSIK